MRFVTAVLFCLKFTPVFSQFQNHVSLAATGHFNVAIHGLGANDAGAGFRLHAAFFANHKLQALLEAGCDRFVGDKVLHLDEEGHTIKSPAFYSITAGPQYFVTKNLALAPTGGAAWYRINTNTISVAPAVQAGITGNWGRKKRLVTRASVVMVSKQEVPVQYFSLGLGHRLL